MKLITWNIQWARGVDEKVDRRRIVDHARQMADFDVLCLQEVAANFPDLDGNDRTDQFALFGELLPGFTAIEAIGVDVPDGEGGRKRFGNLILSRLPVAQALRHVLPWEAAATRNMPRVLVEAMVETPFGPIRVMTTHLEYSSSRTSCRAGRWHPASSSHGRRAAGDTARARPAYLCSDAERRERDPDGRLQHAAGGRRDGAIACSLRGRCTPADRSLAGATR
jgi:hypothetical protein